MKKKLLTLILTSLLLVGCGKKEIDKKEEQENKTKQIEQKNEEKKEEPKEKKLDINDPKSEEPDKDFVKNKTGDSKFKRVYRKVLDKVLEHNGFKFTFKKVAITKIIPITDKAIEDLKKIDNINLVKDKEYIDIGLTIDVENNNDKIYNLVNQDTFLTTNLKEQAKTLNFFRMEDDKFLPNTKKTLNYEFIFPNTNIEDIDKITELTILTPRRFDETGCGYEKDRGTTVKIKLDR